MTDTNSRIDTSRPHTARIWNYWTGGKDNYPVDRRAGDEIRELHPGIGAYAKADRLFLGRAVRHLAEREGVTQFLDIGTGLPSADNTHEVAQRVTPDARVVYVDNDPLVLAHAQALLVGTPEGRIDYLDADLRDVDAILAAAARTLDFLQPVGLMLLGVVIFIEDDEESYGIVRRLLDALAPGSHLVLSHTVTHPDMPDVDEAVAFWNEHGTPKLTQRTPAAVARYFEGLDLLEPGVVSCSAWRAATPSPDVAMYAGVGRK
ncbi:SAM-dependent methyltransferase [Streptomyces sp. OspMP-M43]|uniref:SAM-dependent methyltransferase n=1 Tax=Streptomyces sp. OspMP-M43 TaxID=1839781 RepID=UPI00081BA6B4|nr:SAM-dependent methyltransferase [Streptomyces sp. OspMP-M43]SCE55536.1 O-Methyltransferase involved in polyketide biosynthesis [Streptomyces sp. OspMP-M43]